MAKAPIHLHDLIEDKARSDAGYAIAYSLLKLARAQEGLAVHVKYLGNGNASTEMGAIEALGMVIKEGIEHLADAIDRDDT